MRACPISTRHVPCATHSYRESIGTAAVIASFFPLQDVILALTAARIVIQFNAQVIALFLIRARRPDIHRPFKVWLYALPPLVSLYLLAARRQREWPFE